MVAILSTHTRQLASPFSISELSLNRDESSSKHLIEHLVVMREISKFKHKQDRLRYKQNQLAISGTNHYQRPQLYTQINIKIQGKNYSWGYRGLV